MAARLSKHWAVKPPVGSVVNLAHPLARGLATVALFNEGAGQKIGNAAPKYAGIAGTGAALSWSAGKVGKALKLNGSTARVRWAWSTASFLSGKVALAFRFKLNSSPGTNSWQIFGDDSNGAAGGLYVYFNGITTGRKLEFFVNGGTGAGGYTSRDFGSYVGQWFDVYCEWDGATGWRIEVDGVNDYTSFATTGGRPNTSLVGRSLGCFYFSGAETRFADVSFEYFYHWEGRTLSVDERRLVRAQPYSFIAPTRRPTFIGANQATGTYTVSATESATATTTQSAAASASRTVAEAASAAGTQSASGAAAVTRTEAANAAASASATVVAAVSTTATASAAATQSVQATLAASASAAASAATSQAASMAAAASRAETASAAAAPSASLTATAAAAEAVTALATQAQTATLTATRTDAASAADASDGAIFTGTYSVARVEAASAQASAATSATAAASRAEPASAASAQLSALELAAATTAAASAASAQAGTAEAARSTTEPTTALDSSVGLVGVFVTHLEAAVATAAQRSRARVSTLPMGERIYTVLPESRLYDVPPELRQLSVAPERRVFDVDPEARTFHVPAEDRTYPVEATP